MSSVNLSEKTPTWTLQTEDGSTAVDFDVFLEMEFVNQNQVAVEPIEQGSFADYNKHDSPKELTVTLACTKTYPEQQPVLEALDKLAASVQKISLITPSSEYKSLNLEGYGYARKEDSGAGMLVVELKLIEIREVEVKETTVVASEKPKAKPITKAQAKNPSNTSTAKTGRTQTKAPRKTVARSIGDKCRGFLGMGKK